MSEDWLSKARKHFDRIHYLIKGDIHNVIIYPGKMK